MPPKLPAPIPAPDVAAPPPAAPPLVGDTMDSLAAEAAAAAPPAAPALPETPPPPPADEGLRFGCRAVTAVVGSIVTARAGVDALTPDEVERVGDALAEVARWYIPQGMNNGPTMAWVALLMACGSVAAPRMAKPASDDANATHAR